jgi:hypothetical protein
LIIRDFKPFLMCAMQNAQKFLEVLILMGLRYELSSL